MSLEKHFNIKRFFHYVKYDLRLNAKMYLFFAIGTFVAIIFVSFFAISSHYGTFDHNYYLPLFILFFGLSWTLVLGTAFPALRASDKTLAYLLLPASNLEKFLTQFILRFPVFVCLFFLSFWGGFKCADFLYHLFEWQRPVTVDSFGILSVFEDFNNLGKEHDSMLLFTISIFVVVASFLFAGAAHFKKYALVKNVLAFGALWFAVFLFMVLLSNVFYADHPSNDFIYVKIDDYKMTGNMYNIPMFLVIISWLSSILLLPLAYNRLKEREV